MRIDVATDLCWKVKGSLNTKKWGKTTKNIRESFYLFIFLFIYFIFSFIVLVNALSPSTPPTPRLPINPLASLPVWHLCKSQRREQPRRVVLFCLWEPSCAMLLCPGPEPSPIVCCHMEVSSNTEISLSSCCSLTFSGTQLALNGKIYNYPRYPCWLCLVIVCWGLKEGAVFGWGRGWELGFFFVLKELWRVLWGQRPKQKGGTEGRPNAAWYTV